MRYGLDIDGPDLGDRIGHLSVLNEQGEPATLDDLPGHNLVIVFFRGHW